MENKYDVSLVIPTYNVMSKTIGKDLAIDLGLNTIKNQLVEGFSLEIIFVDDFSTDNTVEHILKWISNHPKINAKMIPMQERGYGPGPGRNFGMSHAQGEFIFFMDNDDQLGGPGCLFEMFQYAKKCESDVVIGTVEGKGEGHSVATSLFKEGNIEKVTYFDINPIANVGVYSRLFKRSFVEEIGAHFPKVGENQIYEDLYFPVQVMAKNPHISILTNQTYYYWVRTDGDHLHIAQLKGSEDKFKQMFNMMKLVEDSPPIIQAAYLERMLDLGPVIVLLDEVRSRKHQMLRSSMHYQLQEKIKENLTKEIFSYLPYMKQLFVKIIIENDYINAVEKYKAYKFLKAQPAIVELKNPLAEMDVLSIAMAKESKYKDLKNELDSISADVEREKISFSISNNQQEVSILVCDRELKKRKYFQVVNRGISASETTKTSSIEIKEIVDLFGKNNVTVDFYKVSEDASGRLLEMIPVVSSFKGKNISVKDATVKAYKNWKGSLSLVMK